jgi:hypothetical protein
MQLAEAWADIALKPAVFDPVPISSRMDLETFQSCVCAKL